MTRTNVVIISTIILLLLISKKVSAEDIISKFEGIKFKAYPDSGEVWTIGYGSTFNPITGQKVKEGDVITKDNAIKFLKYDIAQRQNALKKMIRVPVTNNQLSALTSLAYNIGLEKFRISSILRLLNDKAPLLQVADRFLLYNKGKVKGVLTVLPGLVRRRKEERDLFLS